MSPCDLPPDPVVVAALVRAHRGRPWLVAHVESNTWLAASSFLVELNRIERFPWRVAEHLAPDVVEVWDRVNRAGLSRGLATGVGTGPPGVPLWCEWRSSRLDAQHTFGTGRLYDPLPALAERWPQVGAGTLRVLAAATALLPTSGAPTPVASADLVAPSGRALRSVQRDLRRLAHLGILALEGGEVSAPWLQAFCDSLGGTPGPDPQEPPHAAGGAAG